MKQKTPLWRQTSLAVFPVSLGFVSLALGWRNAADVFTWISPDFGNLLLGLSAGYFIWFLMFYLAKVVTRPKVVLEDVRTPPARAGLAAAGMSMLVLSGALLPMNFPVLPVWWLGVGMQVLATVVVLNAIWKDSPEVRHFSTFQYLTFVGPVISSAAGISLGYSGGIVVVTSVSLVAYVILTVGFIVTLTRKPMPQMLRPSVTILLAPVCLFALSYGGLGYAGAFALFYWVSSAVAVGLLFFVPWMARGGYTPIWAAFTFPAAAFLNVQVMAMAKGYGAVATIGTYGALAIATPVICYMAYRTMMEWVTGDLARKSGAAIA